MQGDEFERFKELTRKLLAVPKKELGNTKKKSKRKKLTKKVHKPQGDGL